MSMCNAHLVACFVLLNCDRTPLYRMSRRKKKVEDFHGVRGVLLLEFYGSKNSKGVFIEGIHYSKYST